MFAVPALSVDDLQSRAAEIEWFESVAVIAELAAATASLGETHLPDLAAIGLTVAGEAAVAPGVPAVDTAVRQLGRALDGLITATSAPEPLRQLAAFATNAATGERLEQFAAALHYYERPNRSQILRNLAARFVTPGQDVDVEAELARLRQRASERSQQQTTRPPRREHRLPRLLKSRWVIWPAALTVLAAGGVVAYWKVPAARDAVSSSWAWARSFVPAAETTPAPGEAPQAERSAPRMSSAVPRAAEQPAATSASPAPAVPSEVPSASQGPLAENSPSPPPEEAVPANALVTLVTETAGPPPAAVPPPADGIYTPATPGITPPVPLRQSIATEPDPAALQEAGVLELVIDDTGLVERVRLVSSSGRFQDRMLLAAAKAWRFKPATLDGRPVRFRTQVRLTW